MPNDAPDSTRDADIPPLVLASASPRRARLLEMLGLRFDTFPAEVDETLEADEPAAIAAERLAREKAEQVAARRPGALVVAGDTLVTIDDRILGKPATEEEAVEMLLALQDREHRVETGIAVAAPDGAVVASVDGAHVHFRPFDERAAREYVATGEPMDKAGAYGIQGYGATLVDLIEGDFYAVMGLPLARMVSLFHAVGWRYDFRGFEPL